MNLQFKKSGFTLVELIVSLAITSVIAYFVFSFSANLAELWRNTESGIDTELDTQIALDRIAMDLESAIFQERLDSEGTPIAMFAASAVSKVDYENDNLPVGKLLAAYKESARPSTLHCDLANHRYGWGGCWLRFFGAAPGFNAISYRIVRRPPFGPLKDRPMYLLHRSVIDQDETFMGGLDIVNGSYDGDTNDALRRPSLDGLLLEDVIDFGIRAYIFDTDFPGNDFSPPGMRLIFPSDDSGAPSEEDLFHYGSSNSAGDFESRYPHLVEVFIRVLDDVGSEMLINLESGDSTETYENIVDKHSRVYRRLVRLHGDTQ